MPRVNRDLQRRMAARRERERRRPSSERRYRFTSAEPAPPPEEALLEADGAVETPEDYEAPATKRPAADALGTTAGGRGRLARETLPATPASTSSRAPARAASRPFSTYKDEYAYVYSDLRRVGLVIGSLLLILIVLYFVLPAIIR